LLQSGTQSVYLGLLLGQREYRMPLRNSLHTDLLSAWLHLNI
jgi:hypothetical protein